MDQYECEYCGALFTLAAHRAQHQKACIGNPLTMAGLLRVGNATYSDTGCLEWHKKRNWCGYGVVADISAKQHGDRRVHRLAYRVAFGDIPEGLDILHKCDNPPCFNPEHLYAGTAFDNIHDALDRGRFHSGRRPECWEDRTCAICGTVFNARRSMKTRTCSVSCARTLAWVTTPKHNYPKHHVVTKGRETRVCTICGTPFETTVSSTKQTCSKTCGNAYRAARATEARNAKRTIPEYTCEVCGVVFATTRNHHKTCSKECGYALRLRNRSKK